MRAESAVAVQVKRGLAETETEIRRLASDALARAVAVRDDEFNESLIHDGDDDEDDEDEESR